MSRKRETQKIHKKKLLYFWYGKLNEINLTNSKEVKI